MSGLGSQRFRLAQAFIAYNAGGRLAAENCSSNSARTRAALVAASFDGGLSPACLMSFRRVSGLMSQAITVITVTTLDPAISRTLGPRAAALLRRLRTIRTLAEAGIWARVRIAPIISFVTKPEIERMRSDGVWADFIRQRFRKQSTGLE
jgi:hypothetical protein